MDVYGTNSHRLCSYPTNWYNSNWLIWICMILIHINPCFYCTNWYNINWLKWICKILIHINLCHKKEIKSWISFAWTILYELVCTNFYYFHSIILFIWYVSICTFLCFWQYKKGWHESYEFVSLYGPWAKNLA
jgi:hypothetical protein